MGKLGYFTLAAASFASIAISPRIVFRLQNPETIPYVNRTRFIDPTKASTERISGQREFEKWKQQFQGMTLPSTHSHSVRVTRIAKNIVGAMHSEINKMRAISEDISQYGFFHRVWLRMTRKLPPSLSHLDGLNWEVLIVTGVPVRYFPSLVCPGGKIIASTAFIELLPSDVELATMLAHEIAHIMARHGCERRTKVELISMIHRVLNRFVTIDFYQTVRNWIDHRFEFEADYIGLLLMAAAGYDPRQAPKYYEKMAMLDVPVKYPVLARFLVSHPSGRERAKAVARPKIMNEALLLYNDVRGRRWVE